jgi:hypothetical protein
MVGRAFGQVGSTYYEGAYADGKTKVAAAEHLALGVTGELPLEVFEAPRGAEEHYVLVVQAEVFKNHGARMLEKLRGDP